MKVKKIVEKLKKKIAKGKKVELNKFHKDHPSNKKSKNSKTLVAEPYHEMEIEDYWG